MHAMILELLHEAIVPELNVLDIGFGSGFLMPCFHYLQKIKTSAPTLTSVVVGVECNKEAFEFGRQNLCGNKDPSLFNFRLFCTNHFFWLMFCNSDGDGSKGVAKYAPYCAINVGAAMDSDPTDLLALLAPGGRLTVPITAEEDAQFQKVTVYSKLPDGSIEKKQLCRAIFGTLKSTSVPLQEYGKAAKEVTPLMKTSSSSSATKHAAKYSMRVSVSRKSSCKIDISSDIGIVMAVSIEGDERISEPFNFKTMTADKQVCVPVMEVVRRNSCLLLETRVAQD